LSGIKTLAGVSVVILYLGGVARDVAVKLTRIKKAMVKVNNLFVFILFSPFAN
jgi:hypothetical protein